jgi:hypothetical protein
MEKKKPLPDLIITEIILIKAGWHRTYWGSIKRNVDSNGTPILSGEVIIEEGKVWSRSQDEEELLRNMDDICMMKLDYGLHADHGRTTIILFGSEFYLN